MRVSTGMIYDKALTSIQRQTSTLMHTQQQLATGRRLLAPSDDPIAATQALNVTQSKEINLQYAQNRAGATEKLGLQENQLAAAGNLLQRVRELAIQANSALNDTDRRSIGTELRGIFESMLGIANTKDGNGQYLFSGYKGDTQPFSGTVSTGVDYDGDDGQRLMQISSSRQISASDAGSTVFMNIPEGNGSFATAASGTNTGSGLIDAGTITDLGAWNGGSFPAGGVKIVFAVSAGATTYDIQDAATSTSLLSAPLPYVSGQPISLLKQTAPAADYGARVVITGEPVDGDTFTVTAGGNQPIFDTLADLITAVESPTTTAGGRTRLANRVGSALANLSQAEDNLLSVRASIGARMNEIDLLNGAGEDLDVQYASTLSRLQDVDVAEAVTRLTQQQIYLEAAQKSFMKVSGLSLFNFV